MKAVILEKSGKTAAAMTADGKVVRVNSRRMSVGDRFDYQPPHMGTKIAALAVCILLVLGFGAFAYAMPAGSVSLDVNPSITYTVNIFDRVLKVTAVNDDGQEIVNEIGLKNLNHKTISDAIEATIAQLIAEGYITPDAEINGAVIAASGMSEKKAQKLAEKLGAVAQECSEEQNCEINVECIGVGRKRVEKAAELQTTPGKLNLVEKLQKSLPEGEEIDVNEWLNKPVKEIMKAIKENNGNGSGKGKNNQSDEDVQDEDDDENEQRETDQDETDETGDVTEPNGKGNNKGKDNGNGKGKDKDKDKGNNSSNNGKGNGKK